MNASRETPKLDEMTMIRLGVELGEAMREQRLAHEATDAATEHELATRSRLEAVRHELLRRSNAAYVIEHQLAPKVQSES